MATNRKGSKKTERSSASSSTGVEGGNDSKRPRTATDTDTDTASASASANEEDTDNNNNHPPQAVSSDSINSASESSTSITTANSDDDEDNSKLPTPVELSKELCKIVDTGCYSRDKTLTALENLYKWAETEDSDFLKYFDIHGGIAKVLDFLNATMNDKNCKGQIRMECIEMAARVIAQVIYPGENAINEDITTKIATTFIDYDGIDTLINASEEYTGGKDVPQLKSVDSVWNAFRNLTTILMTNSLISQDKAITIFERGIDLMSQLKSVDNSIASEILEDVFFTFNHILYDNNHLTKKYFQDKNILSKCLEVFKNNGAWDCRTEEVTKYGIQFFDSCCNNDLIDDSSDYEMILPLLVVVLKKFPSNDKIRVNAMNMIYDSCSTINDKKIIERSGALEVLAALLASDDTNDEAEKDTVRTLIGKIVA
jgi:hypothetical protein